MVGQVGTMRAEMTYGLGSCFNDGMFPPAIVSA